MSAAREWRGLIIARDRLWIGRPGRGLRQIRFEPVGATIVESRGETVLRWDDYREPDGAAQPRGWTITGGPGSSMRRPHVLVSTMAPDRRDESFVHGQTWLVPQRWSDALGLRGFAWREPLALTAYLAATPTARAGLADPVRLDSMLTGLSPAGSRKPAPPRQPLMGDALDLHLAIARVLDRVWPRRFEGLPIAGEVRPDPQPIIDEVRDALSPRLRERVSADQVAAIVTRQLAVGAWPFSLLDDR